MKKNNINKENVNLVQTFVDIVNKDKLSELEYESDGLKIKIVSRSILQDKSQNQIIQKIEKQEIDILIATSVIEVGIDVHNASIMAIMNPERFGLSAIHQLRGRVGRGQKPGFCFLICDNQVSESSLKRLKVIEQNTNGFKIAEEDLISRGEGNLFGTSQSGSSSYRKIGNIITDQKLLISAREDFLDLVDSNQSFINSNFKNIANQEFVSKTI